MQLSSQGLMKPLNLVHCKGKWYWLCVLGCAAVRCPAIWVYTQQAAPRPTEDCWAAGRGN